MTVFTKKPLRLWEWDFDYQAIISDETILEKLRAKWPGGYSGSRKVWDGRFVGGPGGNDHILGFNLPEEELVKLWAELFL